MEAMSMLTREVGRWWTGPTTATELPADGGVRLREQNRRPESSRKLDRRRQRKLGFGVGGLERQRQQDLAAVSGECLREQNRRSENSAGGTTDVCVLI
ncbi:unnamed protein product [Linum trigynum]|uniref:Uncharacterized protein n=1 Tax=Linum trigynum TaxID=586398 RepID=A0AAV2EV62_9ROSI